MDRTTDSESLSQETAEKTHTGGMSPQITELTTEVRLLTRYGESLAIGFDIEHQRPLLIRVAADYSKEVKQSLSDLQMGNRATVRLVRNPTERAFRIERVQQKSTETLLFVENPVELVGEPQTAWEAREQQENVGVKYLYEEQTEKSGQVPVIELQTHPNAVKGDEDLWELLTLGLYPVEQWYTDPVGVETPISDIIVVNPQLYPFVAVYIFTEGQEARYRRAVRTLGVSAEIVEKRL